MIDSRTARPGTLAIVLAVSMLLSGGCAGTHNPAVASTPRGVIQTTAIATGQLSYTGQPVPQNGEVVFNGLPAGNIRLTYDTRAWSHRLVPQPDGKQRLILVSLKPGTQKKCDIQWELIR